MAACFGEQLSNFLPHPVLKRLICEQLDQLWAVTDLLINECFRMTTGLVMNNDSDASKGDILLNKLLPAFREVAVSYLNEKNRAIHEQLQELIRLEKHDPYTINHYYMDTINKFKEHLEKQKSKKTAENNSSSLFVVDNKDDDELMFDSISNDEQAVQEMLISIVSYWKVLTKRFVDYTALALRAGCDFDVCPGIRERLRCVPAEQCDFVDSYLAEDAYVRTKRKQLQQTQERLEKADAILGGHSVTGASNVIFTDSMMTGDNSLMTLDVFAKNLSVSDVNDATNSISTRSVPILTTGSVDQSKRK